MKTVLLSVFLVLVYSNAHADPMDAYRRCNQMSAKLIAHERGDPLSLAKAAEDMCLKERREVLHSFGTGENANSEMKAVQSVAVDQNAAIIVTERLTEAPASSQRSPSE